MPEYKLFIGGEFVDAASGETYDSTNPSTGEPVARVALGGAEDARRAIAAAAKARDSGVWSGLAPVERSRIMLRALEKLTEAQQELSELEMLDAGHTARMASLFMIPYSNEFWRYQAELAARVSFQEPVEPYGFPTPAWDFVLLEPYGVAGSITPWNVPYMESMWQLGPALAAGNTVVLKPAPETPVSTLRVAQVLAESDIPPGVVNILTGGADVGQEIVTNGDVDLVSFTGSTETGKRIMQLASGTLKKVILELGGKSPNILLEDADLDMAIPGALWALFLHQGQLCQAGSRLFVPSALYDEVVARLVESAEGMVVGDASEYSSDLGPLISGRHHNTVERYVQLGQEEGAKLLTGGYRITEGVPAGGFYYAPTIFGDVDNSMKVAQEEIFGPVLVVIRYESVDDAIRMANDSIYGLAGGVWSTDVQRALAVARRLKTGTVWVNDFQLIGPHAPFGGYKQSGIGREHGIWGLREYLQEKYVRVSQERTRDEKFWFQVLGL